MATCQENIERRNEMGIRLYTEPRLEKPDLICGWPGIGSIGIIAIEALKDRLGAMAFGEIEPWDFFYPRKVSIKGGLLEDLEFPTNKFYFRCLPRKDLIFFIGSEQPTEGRRMYATGEKAYRMANLVLDVAEKFSCQRVYTSGAAVAPIHHTMRSKVWAVPNREDLIEEAKRYENTIIMSKIERGGGQGSISGLNGLLLGVAKKRGLEGICLMGEIPSYLQGLPFPYPKASKLVLEVLTKILGIRIDLSRFDQLAQEVEEGIEKLYQQFPSEVRDQLEKLKQFSYIKPTEPEPITEEDQRKIMEGIDEFFKKGRGDERPI